MLRITNGEEESRSVKWRGLALKNEWCVGPDQWLPNTGRGVVFWALSSGCLCNQPFLQFLLFNVLICFSENDKIVVHISTLGQVNLCLNLT